MPRKRNEKKEQSENFNKAFPTVMRQLMKKTTQADLAEYLSKTRQSITYYCDGSSSPDWETLVKIADFFNVSTDYLLGRTDEPSRQPCAADDLGLTAEAIAYIRHYSNPARSKDMEELVKPDDCLKGLSMLIESGRLLGLSGEIKRFHDTICQNIQISKAYQDSTPAEAGDDYYKWRHAAEEDLLAKQFQNTLEAQFPAFKGTFEILVGRHIVEHQKRVIVDYFDEMLRNVSKYSEFERETVKW